MFKVDNKNNRTTSVTLPGVFSNFEHISTPFSRVYVVEFEEANVSWFMCLGSNQFIFTIPKHIFFNQITLLFLLY